MFLLRKMLFGNGKHIERKCAFWNMMYSVLFALQSAILLLSVTRICGAEEGGIFSIAYATAQLMCVIGTYGVRNFHVTDTCHVYSYRDYVYMRVLSCTAMAVISIAYCLLKQYGIYKSHIVLCVCALKLLEAVEDLYQGELQREGRLDIAGRASTLRLFVSDLAFLLVLLITKDLIAALYAMLISVLLIVFGTRCLFGTVFSHNVHESTQSSIRELVIACFPLFLTGFLGLYICNAPKYAIDSYLTESAQALFSIIFMPVFTINLLSGIIYRPRLNSMAELWNRKDIVAFRKIMMKQCAYIGVISIAIFCGGMTIGLKLLELLYGVSLDELRLEFAVLLIGGGMVSLYNFLVACVTLMRRQRILILVSIALAILAAIISNTMVFRLGLSGASWAYFVLMCMEALAILAIFCFYYRQALRAKMIDT